MFLDRLQRCAELSRLATRRRCCCYFDFVIVIDDGDDDDDNSIDTDTAIAIVIVDGDDDESARAAASRVARARTAPTARRTTHNPVRQSTSCCVVDCLGVWFSVFVHDDRSRTTSRTRCCRERTTTSRQTSRYYCCCFFRLHRLTLAICKKIIQEALKLSAKSRRRTVLLES